MIKRIIILTLVTLLSFGKIVFAEPIEAGFGKIKLNGLLQFWYQNDNAMAPKDNFRLRRSEFKFSGEIKPEVTWAIMFDPAQVREDDVATITATNTAGLSKSVVTSAGRKSVLQDFLISLKLNKNTSIDFGQYKVPFGMEGLESSAKLDFVERSILAHTLKWADYRDIGFTLKTAQKTKNDVEIQAAIGLFNGEGQNKWDANQPMDFVGRFVVKPNKNLHLGIAHYNGKTGTTKVDNERTGGEIKYIKDPVSIYGEYVDGESGGKDKKTYYISAGYKFPKSPSQLVLRHDWYDPDTNTSSDAKTESSIGLNYFLEKHNSKIRLNYIFRGEQGASVDDNVLRFCVQVSY